MTDRLARRVRQARSRLAVRAWEYRQRQHAKGVWMRLSRILADARVAYVIPDIEAEQLLAEGFRPEAVGKALEPPKAIFFVPEDRAARLHGAEEIPVRLEVALLQARALVLVRFPS